MYNALQYLALHTSPPLNITLIAASSPVWMLFIGRVVYRVRPGRHQVIGAALSLAGVALVLSRGELATLAGVRLVAGDLWMLLATIAWAFYSWLLARPPRSMLGEQRPDWNWAEFLMVQIAFGLVWAAAASGVEIAVVGMPLRWSTAAGLAIAFMAIGPSLVAYYCWGKGVAAAGPATAAFFANLTPVFTALLSGLLLGLAARVVPPGGVCADRGRHPRHQPIGKALKRLPRSGQKVPG